MTRDLNLDSEIPLNKTILEQEEQERAARLNQGKERWRRRWRKYKIRLRVLTLLLLVGLFVWVFRQRIFYNVNSGEVLVIYYRFFGGTGHNSIGLEGLHILAPWDKGYIYVVRTQTLVVPMSVLTRNGVQVHLDA